MDTSERKAFWDALCGMHNFELNSIQKMNSKIITPKYLCRFRSVNNNTLLQLQENKLFYSSANYYDDPFDTFIHVDYERINRIYTYLTNQININSTELCNLLNGLETVTGMNGKAFMNVLRDNPFDISSLPKRVENIRTIIQKSLFSICFCENELNETLWLKYASNYAGFALVYDLKDVNTFLCGTEEMCKKCITLKEKPTIYPVYYSDEPYDATQFALSHMIMQSEKVPSSILKICQELIWWEAERISLIKKKCHEYDEEWRMIRPAMINERTCIKMKPCKLIMGFRMPKYERQLVASAARVAGIINIEELYIDNADCLSSKPLQ